MLLPETVLFAGLIIFGASMTDHLDLSAGQQAMASVNGMIQDGVPTPEMRHRQKSIQQHLRNKPQDMLQINGTDIVGALGYSDLKRIDGDMTVLQFRGENCVLDLYLNSNSANPVSYEFRSRQLAGDGMVQDQLDVRPQSCIDDILKSRRT